ncbi:MAG: hypothetical protein FWH18_01745 [Marinilabiliaceae bacterium]|nr:hypothetical protein [Marinilabiliaceae bacterium]
MKKLFFVLVVSLLVWGCGGGAAKKTEEPVVEEPEVVEVSVLAVDEIVASAENYLDKEVTLQGLCKHVCKQSGKKLVLEGAKDVVFVFTEQDFDLDLEGKKLQVTGKFSAFEPEEGHKCEAEIEAKFKIDLVAFEIIADETPVAEEAE